MIKKQFQFLKNMLKFVIHPVNLILYIFVAILSIVLYNINILALNSANYTWIYSTSMQVLAAMIALLPISYSFYLARVDEEQDYIIDRFVVTNLKKDGYYNLMFVILFSIITIIVNLVFLFLTETVLFALIATVFTLLSIQYAAVFIYRLFNPERVNELLKELDTSSKNVEPSSITLDEFITQYLLLETEVKDYISNENDNEIIDKLPLYDIVDQFSKDIPIMGKHYDTFKEIIYHRNNIIHNYTDVSIDLIKYEQIKVLIDEFKKLNEQFISENIFNNVLSIKSIIDKAIKDYNVDYRNVASSVESTTNANYEEIMSNVFQEYFIGQYYNTLDSDEANDTDFEIIQNNYSERRILGIELRMTNTKSFNSLSKQLFKQLGDKYMYLFVINNNVIDHLFEIKYMKKDKTINSYTIDTKEQ